MKTLYYLKRAFSMPPHIVIQKVFRKLKREYEARKKRVIDERFPTFERHCPFGRLNRFVSHLECSNLPVERILEWSRHSIEHEFDLLGSGWIKVSGDREIEGRVNRQNWPEAGRIWSLIRGPYDPIDWQLDFKSGYRWQESVWSQDIVYGTVPGADVKVPWELSRMQHLVSLAWSYGLEAKSIYSDEFRNQILDFVATNPPRYGVNWSCTMDVGIRVANWLLAWDMFRYFGAIFDAEFEAVFIRSVYEHGRHIISHLEWDPYLRSNHYLANLAGLLFVATYTACDSWLDFAVRELEKEVLLQFHPDGSNFEASTSYHRLSTEMVVYATALSKESFSKEYLQRIEKMAEFIGDITKPDGRIVQFGDNDSGRFIRLFPETDSLDHRYLVSGIENMKDLSSLMIGQLKGKTKKTSNAYPDFGLYILSDGPWFLAVRCGSIGQNGNGGHAHHDQLSFELAVKGISMLVDPGTYVYTPIPEARRHFRSTAMHNTLAVEGVEQNRDEGLFKLGDRAKARMIQFGENLFVGEHEGFGAVHRRTLRIIGNRIEGIDEYAGAAQIYFHFAPGWKGESMEGSTLWSRGDVRVCISGEGKIEEGEYSSSYGKKEPASVLILKDTQWNIQLL